jgi:diguanylate cyclase (GGDEF)-like protein
LGALTSLSGSVLRALVTAGRLAAGALEVEPVLAGIAHHLAGLVWYDAFAVAVRDAGDWRLAQASGVLVAGGLPPVAERALQRALAAATPVVVLEEAQAPVDGAAPGEPARLAALAVPFAEAPVSGVFVLLRRGGAAFPPGEIEIVEAFAGLAAVSLARAHVYEQACARALALARLQEISLALNADLDPRRVLQRIVDAATSLTGALFTSVVLVDPTGAPYDYVTDDPLADDTPLQRAHPFQPDGTTDIILKTGQVLVIDDVARDPRIPPAIRQRGLGTSIGLPLLVEGEAIGVLWVNFARPRRPSPEELALLVTLAAQASTALRNANLYVEARRLADRDPLTSLVNYRTLQERLRQQMAVARRTGEPLSIVMLDLNDFKQVNDTLGHLAGDALLRRVAAALAAVCRESDTVGRYGGDEFLLILPHTDGAGAQALVARIREHLAALSREAGLPGPLGVGAGAATFPSEAGEIEALIALADRRLYESKPRPGRRPVVRPIRRVMGRRPSRPVPPR